MKIELLNEIKKKYWSVTDFCKTIGIDRGTIYKYLKDDNKQFRKSTAELIAKGLEIDLEEIKNYARD